MPSVLPAQDDRYLVVDGRRWRRADPQIPGPLRQELVNELMSARRAVRDATSAREQRRARDRVHDAKLALGERGRAWWLPPHQADQQQRIEATVRALLRSRRTGASICPSDAARIAGAVSWRVLMPAVRAIAAGMAAAGDIDILRAGRVVSARQTEGTLRYRLAAANATPTHSPAAGRGARPARR